MADTPHEKYCDLYERRPELFGGRDPNGYVILPPDPEVSAVIYSDEFAFVLRDKVQFPDGHAGSYIRIVSPPHCAMGAAILPIVEGRILLLWQFRHATGTQHIEIPRGFGDPGERVIDAARRELFEETGLGKGEFTSLGLVHPDTGLLQTKVELFLYRSSERLDAVRTEAGVEAKFVSIPEALELIADGEITDAFAIVAVLKAQAAGLLAVT